jgi:uncharacterized membrane protein HdeD (DUF308 family)
MITPTSVAPDVAALRSRTLRVIHSHWKLFLVQGIVMLLLGLLAVALPNVSTLEIEQLVGWLFIVGGLVRTASLIRKHHLPAFWWSLSSGVIAMLLGILLVRYPMRGVITLAIVMTTLFVVEGIAAIFIAFEFRSYLRNWIWTLFGGVVTLLLAVLIWQGWPSTATWVIGLYVGINMVFLGTSLIFTAVAARGISSAPP